MRPKKIINLLKKKNLKYEDLPEYKITTHVPISGIKVKIDGWIIFLLKKIKDNNINNDPKKVIKLALIFL